MKRELRKLFDARVDAVLKTLPAEVLDIINNEVPLLVEDYPSDEVMEIMEIEYRNELCGLFTGIGITEKSIEAQPMAPDSVVIYREGIIVQALEADESLSSTSCTDGEDEVNSEFGIRNNASDQREQILANARQRGLGAAPRRLDPELNLLKPSEINLDLLDEEIRITILHEYGHLHGLSDDDLDALGY